MAAESDFFRNRAAQLAAAMRLGADKISGMARSAAGAAQSAPDIEAAAARNAGNPTPPRPATGTPASAFGEFDATTRPKPSPFSQSPVSRLARGSFELGKAGAKLAEPVIRGAAKLAAPVARVLPGFGAAAGGFNMFKEGPNPQNVADTAAGFLPPGVGSALQAGNFALSTDNRYKTAIGSLLDPVIDFAARQKSGIEIGPGGSAKRVAPGPGTPAAAATPATVAPRDQQVTTGRSSAEGDGFPPLPAVSDIRKPAGPEGTNIAGGQNLPQYAVDGRLATDPDYVPRDGGIIQREDGGITQLRGAPVQAPQAFETAQARDDRLFGPREGVNPVPNAQPGVFGEIAAQAGLRSRHAAARIEQAQGNRNADRAVRVRGQDTVAAAAGTRNSIAAAAELRARGAATRTANEAAIADRARQGVDPNKHEELTEPVVKQRTAEMTSAIRFSLSDRRGGSKMSLADAPPAEISRLMVLHDIKQRQKKGDKDFWEGMRELIGTKRFESRNLYDTMPVAISKGRVLHADGNTTQASRVLNNLFNLLSPSDPADVQVQDMLRNLPTIEEYNAGLAAAKAKAKGR